MITRIIRSNILPAPGNKPRDGVLALDIFTNLTTTCGEILDEIKLAMDVEVAG
jgi:hypothetical protein